MTTTATQAMTNQEVDIRQEILSSFMSCPHRDTDKLKEVHETIRERDPLFYAHLAAWYFNGGGDIRDINEVFDAMLLTDPYLPNRETGLALWQKHAAFMKSKILGFVKGKKVKIRTKTGEKIKRGKASHDKVKIELKNVGLGKSIPTAFKTEVTRYLRWLESDNDRFDAVALRNFNELKGMYASNGLQIKPSPRAQAILFDRKYPEDSKLSVFKKIMEAKKPETAARLIVENKIPYTVAVGLIEKITPSILVSLINNMSPQEVINNAASLQEHGVYDNEDFKKLFMAKLEKAKKAKSVSALKSKTAKNTGRVKDEEVKKMLDQVADEQVARKGNITADTAILVDRSYSMTQAIEVGKRVASLVSGASKSQIYVVAFDEAPMEIVPREKTLTGWEEAFVPVRPGGNTSCGVGLDYLMRMDRVVEQIVIITDEGENSHPFFHEAYKEYCKKFNVKPNVVIIYIPSGESRDLSSKLKRHEIAFDWYVPAGNDYYGLPGLLPLLARKSKLDLIYEIMATPLPKRKAYSR